MAPSGEPILRPPANALPPGTEWQATQSPARAKYSPGLLGGLTFSSARDVPTENSKSSPQKTILEIVVTPQASPAGVAPTFVDWPEAAFEPPRAWIVRYAGYTDPERSLSMTGSVRIRLPVAAKIAFATAAAIGPVAGSPAPPQTLPPLGSRWTSIFGASARRTMR